MGLVMAEPEKTTTEKLVNNALLTLFARGAMIVATAVILPLGMAMVNRAVDSIDRISQKIDTMKEQALEQAGEIKSLRQIASTQQQLLADHEARVRLLERGPAARQ